MKAIAILCSAFAAMATAADLDLANLDESKKDERPVSPETLTALIGDANRVVVTESPLQDAKKLFESTERKDLDALSKALVVIKPLVSDEFSCSFLIRMKAEATLELG